MNTSCDSTGFEDARSPREKLTYIMESPHLDATGHCCVKGLASYNFKIEYQTGKHTIVADA